MTHHILKCPDCASYSLHERCGCGGTRVTPKPPKWSPEDKYAAYRRKYKERAAGTSETAPAAPADDKP